MFIPHFESGGTFLDFDPAKVQAHYEQQFNAAKAVWRKRDVFAERRGASFCLASDEIGR